MMEEKEKAYVEFLKSLLNRSDLNSPRRAEIAAFLKIMGHPVTRECKKCGEKKELMAFAAATRRACRVCWCDMGEEERSLYS